MAFWQLTRLRVVYPVVLLLLLFVDGTLMASMGGIFTAFPLHILPTLTVGWLFYGVQFYAKQDMPFWLYVVLIGLLFDVYYTGMIGTYTVAISGSVAVMMQLQKVLDERLLSGLFMFLVGLVVYLVVTYMTGWIVGIADISLVNFALYEVVPTLILNVVIVALGYYPVWSLFQFLR